MEKVCTTTRHKVFKTSRKLFVAFTDFAGWQEDVDDAPLELRTCKLCHSTLCDGTRKAVARAA